MKNNLLKTFQNKLSGFLVLILKPLYLTLERSKIGRLAIYKLQKPNTLLVAEASNLKFVVNSSDMAIGFTTYVNKRAFDSEKLGSLLSLLPPSSSGEGIILFDLGANIGTICIPAVTQGLVSEALAFEPDPNNYALLVSNIAINDLSDKIRHFNYALVADGDPAELKFELDFLNWGDHRIRVTDEPGIHKEEDRKVISVETAKLDDFAEQLDFRRALIWMDVQGFEGYVLRGSKKFTDSKVPIVTEFWPYGLKRAGCFDMFIESIVSASYSTIVDSNDLETKHSCSRQALLNLASHYGDVGSGTDLLIY